MDLDLNMSATSYMFVEHLNLFPFLYFFPAKDFSLLRFCFVSVAVSFRKVQLRRFIRRTFAWFPFLFDTYPVCSQDMAYTKLVFPVCFMCMCVIAGHLELALLEKLLL